MAVQDGGGEDPGEAIKARYLAKCVQKSSVVLHAVYGHIRCSSTFDVVLGKETSLELVVVSEDGIVQSVCEQPVFGTIKDLRVLPWNESRRSPLPQTFEKDLLVLLSDSGKLSFLTFNIELHRFLAVAHVHIADFGNFRRELGRLLAVEPRGRAVAVAAFEDRIAIFPASIASGNNIVDKRMIYPKELLSSTGLSEASTSGVEEKFTGWGTVWSMTFVDMPGDHVTLTAKSESLLLLVVLVHRKGAASNEIFILTCDTKERIIQAKARYDPSTIRPFFSPLGISILDVPAAPGFLLLSRPGELLLLDLRRPSSPSLAGVFSFQKILDEEEGSLNSVAASALLELLSSGQDGNCKKRLVPNGESAEIFNVNFDPLSLPTITAWNWEPYADGQSRLALAMDTGEVHLARLSFKSSDDVPRIEVQQRQYKCSPCNLVLWTKGDFLAVFVEMGDGQVLQCTESGKVTCKSLIQNLAPILDFALADYHSEKQDQMFACSGAGIEGSLRVIRNGISVEKLHTTSPMYQGVTGTYTMRMCRRDPYHAFFVMSFVQETRVLSVGLNFVDITEAVGFQPCATTLACGTIEDYHVVQVCSKEVTVCVPTKAAHPAGIDSLLPLCSSWKPPPGLLVSLGAVANKIVILALSKPGLIVMLGSQQGDNGALELCILQRCKLKAELSCISIPDKEDWTSSPLPPSIVGLVEGTPQSRNPAGVEVGRICVVGTHEPSVEVLSIVPGECLAPLAVGHISLVSCVGTTLSGCVPESVRLAQFDGLYILAGLRNGMLLRYEWPAGSTAVPPGSKHLLSTFGSERVEITQLGLSGDKDVGEKNSPPVSLHLVAVRRIGVSPVSLISLQASLSSDIVALSDRPWLLQTARHSQRIAYTSISFPPSTHATPVNSIDCPNGILFVADCSLHLVEMEHLKRLNVQKLPLGRTPRRVLYHSVSKTLIVMRTDSGPDGNLVSDLCCVDPVSGASHSCYTLDAGEVARSIQLWKYKQELLLLVGTSLTRAGVMSSGEAVSSKGRLLVFQLESKSSRTHSQVLTSSTSTPTSSNQATPGSSAADPMVLSDSSVSTDEGDFVDGEVWEFRLKTHVLLPGAVLAVCSHLGQYILASAGNCLFCLGFPSDSPQRPRKFAMVKTRFMITSIAAHLSRIAVGDCRDGILFYSYQEVSQQLEQLYCDPIQQLVADCVLMDIDTAAVTDRRGNFCTLSSVSTPEESVSPERNLSLTCWFHVGETLMRIHKASFAYESPTEESLKNCGSNDAVTHSTHSSVVASSLLGSVFIFIKVTREEYDLLKAVQERLAFYPLTAPLLGNNHDDYRSQGCPAGVCKVLDGDMLCQFLELTSTQQETVLTEPQGVVSLSVPNPGSSFLERSLPVDRVLRLLERVHNSLA